MSPIAPGLVFSRREALITAARSLGITTGVETRIEELESELKSLPEPVPSRDELRRRVAETASELEAKREHVATTRGRLEASDDGSVRAEYRAAIRALSEAETEHVAAKEALEAARTRARKARDTRERRLHLEDQLANCRRTERAELRTAVIPKVNTAVSKLPGREYSSFDAADPVSAALALVRVSSVEVPITLACRRFPDRESAERWLQAPVYRL